MLNRICITGHLVRDPELKTTNTGKTVATITVAVRKRIKPKGTDEADADFFRVQAWGQTAEYVCNYLGKGRLVAVDGRMESRKFKDANGNPREAWEIVADNITGLDRPRDDAPASQPKTDMTGTFGDAYDPFGDE